jgi:uncharacterized protein (TIGR02246 family)
MSRQADEEALYALDRRRIDAAAIGDAEALVNVFAENHVHVHGSGLADSREEFAASVGKLPRLTDPRRPLIRFFGDDVAVLTGPLTLRLGRNGEGEVAHMYATQVAHRSNGEWRFVSMQVTRIRD